MTSKECAKAWKMVVSIYDETRDETPAVTMQRIIKELGKQQAMEVFATVVAMKKDDGRISDKNKEAMNAVEYNHESAVWGNGNPMVYAGLDFIHPAHINQLITELIKNEQN